MGGETHREETHERELWLGKQAGDRRGFWSRGSLTCVTDIEKEPEKEAGLTAKEGVVLTEN